MSDLVGTQIVGFLTHRLTHPFHLSLPVEHLDQSSFCVNQVTFYSILDLEQCQNLFSIYL